MEALEDGLEAGIGVPSIAELHADVGERIAPGPGADEGVDVEADVVHPGDAGGQGDEGANNGQEAADQDRDGTVAGEEALGEIEIVRGEQDVSAEAFDHGAAAARTDPVGRDGAKIGGEGTDGGKEDELHLSGGERETCDRHDDLGGEGDAGGLDRHEQQDAPVTGAGDEAHKEGDKFL